MRELHFDTIKGQARQILMSILQTPEVKSCRLKDMLLLRLACEEIVMNVVSYAYPDDEDGFLDVILEKSAGSVTIRFEDGGRPFNPLEKEKPDTTLSWRKRRIGGLGIYLIHEKMDDIRYEYVSNRNVLTIVKHI